MPVLRVAGLDIGTTRIKLHIYDESLSLVKSYSVASPLVVKDLRASHDPERLLTLVRDLLGKAGREGARTVGLTVYRASVLAWSDDKPLTDIVLWLDREKRVQAYRSLPLLGRLLTRTRLYRSILSPQSPLPLIGYLSRRYRSARVWTLDAFLLDKLTGTFASDASNAALSGLIHPRSLGRIPLAWSAAGLPRGFSVPRIVGNLLDHDIIGSMIADQQAGIVGLGCAGGGCLKLTLGTGAFADLAVGDKWPGIPGMGRIPLVVAMLDGRVYYGLESLVPGFGVSLWDAAESVGGFEFLSGLGPGECLEAWRGALLFPFVAGPGGGMGWWDQVLVGGPLIGGRTGLACAIVVGAALAAAYLVALHGWPGVPVFLAGRLAGVPLIRDIIVGLIGGARYCGEDPTPRGAALLAAYRSDLVDSLGYGMDCELYDGAGDRGLVELYGRIVRSGLDSVLGDPLTGVLRDVVDGVRSLLRGMIR